MTNLTIWTQSRIKYFEKSSYTESDEQHLVDKGLLRRFERDVYYLPKLNFDSVK